MNYLSVNTLNDFVVHLRNIKQFFVKKKITDIFLNVVIYKYTVLNYYYYYYYYYYYKSTDYSDASLKLQGHFTYQVLKNGGRQ